MADMRPLPILSAVFLTVATPVFAQVTVDLHALQALPERSVANRPPRATRQPAPSTPTPGTPAPGASTPGTPTIVTRVPPATAPSAPAPTPGQQPDMPQSIPETAAITPISPPEPPAGSPPPPPPPISDKSATTAAPTTAGLRLTFATGESNLSPESTASIKQLTEAAPPGETTFNVLAYAPGKTDDPSTARRVSLSRAMAVRSALVADGVPSARIFVRALGEQYGDGPPDRVDIGVTGANTAADSATIR